MIWIVYVKDEDSSSGVSLSGIFSNRDDAFNWARSEGPEYQLVETTFGPIDWNKLNPLPPMDWNF